MSLVAELVTKLKVDSAEFSKKISDAGNQVQNFSNQFLKLSGVAVAAIGTAATGAFVGLIKVINDTTQEIDELVNVASKLGTTAASVQKLQYAAKLSDTSMESLNGAMGKLVRTLSDAEQGNKAAVSAFEDIGISVKDLEGMSLDQVFVKISNQIRTIPNALDQAKAANAVFGRGSMEILNMLKTDIGATSEEFEKLGGVLTEEGAQSVAAYDDATKKLSVTLDVFKLKLTEAMAKPLTIIVEQIQKQVQEWGGLEKVAKTVADNMIGVFIGIAKGLQVIEFAIISVVNNFRKLKLLLLETKQAFSNLNFAVTGGDYDFENSLEIARLRKSINESGNSSRFQGVIGGLESAQKQLSQTNQTSKSKLDITVKTDSGFLLDIAGSPELTAAIKNGLILQTAQEARARAS